MDTAFYSHTGDNTAQTTGSQVIPHLNGSKGDWRISVQILSNNQFRWTSHPDLISWSAPIQITVGIINIIPLSSGVGLDFSVEFQNGTYIENDRWVFNIRGFGWNFEGTPTATNQTGFGLPVWDGSPFMSSMVDPNTYGGHAILKTESPIYPGSQINIEIEFDSDPQNPQRSTGIQSFTSSNYYSSFEEWFMNLVLFLHLSNIINQIRILDQKELFLDTVVVILILVIQHLIKYGNHHLRILVICICLYKDLEMEMVTLEMR